MKTVDLKVRPIYHWKSDRIRAHVFLCMLAYYVEWHMRGMLAQLLFDDHEREQAEETRKSIVSKAPRSTAAKQKERTRRTADGFPVQSFPGPTEGLGDSLQKSSLLGIITRCPIRTAHHANRSPAASL